MREAPTSREACIYQTKNRPGLGPQHLATLDNFGIARSCTGDGSFKCLPYQLSSVRYWPTEVVTGNGESGFDSGEGASRNGYHIQGRQQARKLPIPDAGR